MPQVPNVPGVPSLSSYSAPTAITLLVADAINLLAGFGPPQWGLFLPGSSVPVVTADSVISFDYKRDWAISDYPVEQGAFESYDKVQTPFTTRLRFSAGGSASNRQVLLDSIEAIADTLTLFDAATPEAVYESVNVNHVDYRRTAMNGVGLLSVDVWCTEIRVTGTSEFSNTRSPSGSSPVSGGVVSTQSPTPTQQSIGSPSSSSSERFQ